MDVFDDESPAFVPDYEEASPVQAEEEVPAEEDAETVTLAVAAPFFFSAVSLPDRDGGTVVIDRQGTEVPVDDADRLTAEAAAQGITLTRK